MTDSCAAEANSSELWCLAAMILRTRAAAEVLRSHDIGPDAFSAGSARTLAVALMDTAARGCFDGAAIDAWAESAPQHCGEAGFGALVGQVEWRARALLGPDGGPDDVKVGAAVHGFVRASWRPVLARTLRRAADRLDSDQAVRLLDVRADVELCLARCAGEDLTRADVLRGRRAWLGEAGAGDGRVGGDEPACVAAGGGGVGGPGCDGRGRG